MLQAPQLSTSFVTSMQVPPQLASDGSHFTPQTPPEHEGCPPATGGQMLPHAPQLPESEPVSTHRSPHRVRVPASTPPSVGTPPHVKSHWLFAQVGVPPGGAVHAAAQPPQFSGSVERLTH